VWHLKPGKKSSRPARFNPRLQLQWALYYSHHGLVCFEHCWYTVSGTRKSGTFYRLLGKEAQPRRETLSIYERRTVSFSEEHGACPPWSTLSTQNLMRLLSALVCRLGPVRIHSNPGEGDRECIGRCLFKIKPFKWINKRRKWGVSAREWSRRAQDNLCYRSRRRSIRNSKGEVCRIFACNAHHESENETLDNRREWVKEATWSWWSLGRSSPMGPSR